MAKSKVIIRDTDRGYKALTKRVFGFKRPEWRVGLLAGTDADKPEQGGPATVLEVGIYNEFGTDRIPPRSFIRAWFDEDADEIKRKIRVLTQRVVDGKASKDDVYPQLAKWCVERIKKRIDAGIAPPNAASTIKRKGDDVPLTETFQMYDAITYQIEDK